MKDISRTAWESFIRCKRCFYLERKLKIKPIGMPGYPINSRVDALLKKEFDIYRDKQEPHPIFTKYKLNFVPYKMDEQKLKDFRNNFKGVRAKSIKTNFIIYGSIDDIWLNKDTDEVVKRANHILNELESVDGTTTQTRDIIHAGQLSFRLSESKLLEIVKSLKLENMTPLEAITKLYELKELVNENEQDRLRK